MVSAESLVLAVMLSVMTAGLDMMMFGMAGMAVGAVGVVRRLLVIAGFMMLGGFTMMFRGVFVVFGSLVVLVFGHEILVGCKLPAGTNSPCPATFQRSQSQS